MADLNESYTAADGRKILSVSNAGTSVSLESTEQAGKGLEALTRAEMAQIKLHAMRRGIRERLVNNPGPIVIPPFMR